MKSYSTKCTTIYHSIMSAVRPKSFLSPLQISLAVMLNRKFASKRIIDIFYNLGVCCSYDETNLYEECLLLQPRPELKSGCFAQFIFDNADFNTNTIDGNNTFHSMGGIKVITPYSCYMEKKNIYREKVKSWANNIDNFENIPFCIYESVHENRFGYNKILAEEMEQADSNLNISNSDFCWLYGNYKIPQILPGWNGFMEKLTCKMPYQMSRVIPLPFINSAPSDRNTIFSALKYAFEEAKKMNLHTCFVTFDQPLYQKAVEMVKSFDNRNDMSRIIVRLGGFHLLMSFLGSVGYIMSGSGIKEVLGVSYAKCSVDKMLTGHAYARAMRGHTLVYLSLCKKILEEIDFSEEEVTCLDTLLCSFPENSPSYLCIEKNEIIKVAKNKFVRKMAEIERRGKTAKLWIEYVRMIALAKTFQRSEKMGNLRLQLETIKQMLPYFHSSGHFNYAKYAHFYVQDMQNYIKRMDDIVKCVPECTDYSEIDEFNNFIENGYSTVRRMEKFWCRNFTDMTIEQDFMRIIKVSGGIIGRGFNDKITLKFLLGLPYTCLLYTSRCV